MDRFAKGLSLAKVSGVLKNLGIQKPYLLFVGSMYPHKNLSRLIEALGLLIRERGFGGSLVLAGQESYFSRQLRAEVARLGLGSRVQFPALKHPLADEEIAALYAGAEVFVFPSLKEGFGIPPLEAQAVGTPVVASKGSCIPEVCGKGALYFNPVDTADIAAQIQNVLSDQKLRENLIAAGRKNVARFSWKKMAQQTLEVYRR